MDKIAIEWFNTDSFTSKTGTKSDKALVKFGNNRASFSSNFIQIAGWKEGDKIAFGQDVKTKRMFCTISGKGFNVRSAGQNGKYLVFTNKALCDKMLEHYNTEKQKVIASGYEPSVRAVFLALELEGDKGVFELLPILN